jgi:hypothetical protein
VITNYTTKTEILARDWSISPILFANTTLSLLFQFKTIRMRKKRVTQRRCSGVDEVAMAQGDKKL